MFHLSMELVKSFLNYRNHQPCQPLDLMLPKLGQCLMELVCQPSAQQGLPLLLAQRLATGLGADFCFWSIALEPPWFWTGTGKQGRWQRKDFIENVAQVLSSPEETAVSKDKDFWLTSDNLPDLKSDLGEICQGAVGIKTYFQGDCNGLVMVGYFQGRGEINKRDFSLIKLQNSLGIINQLLLTTELKSNNASENFLGSSESNLPIILPSSSQRNPFEESAILKVWYEVSRQQLEQQKQWNQQLINSIITVMSDQTRNPLATIRMGIEILQKSPPSPEKLGRNLDIMEEEWHKLNDINEKILQLRELKQEKNTVLCQSFDVLSLLKDIILEKNISCQEIISKRVRLDYITQSYEVDANTGYLQQVFQELLTNAQKFSIPDSIIKISLDNYDQTLAQGEKMIKLTFTNLTPTVDSKNIKYFFEPFYREQWTIDSAIAGIGLGLAITRTLMEQLNGRIDVACEPATCPGQSRMTFTLLIPGSGTA